jgi:circadian clock protein KaiC
VLTGSARLVQEAQEKAAILTRNQQVKLRHIELESKRTTLEAQVSALRAEFAAEEIASQVIIGQERAETAQLLQERTDMGLNRRADVAKGKKNGSAK